MENKVEENKEDTSEKVNKKNEQKDVKDEAKKEEEKPEKTETDKNENKSDEQIKKLETEKLEIEDELKKKKDECSNYVDLLKRSRAEFDNYRKRTDKEKKSMYDMGFSDAIKEILPTIDNLERALKSTKDKDNDIYKGVEMTLKVLTDALSKNGVTEIKTEGEKFDPEYHNAVMHIDDKNYGENAIVEVLQKGYKYKDTVIRYSMVKVAN